MTYNTSTTTDIGSSHCPARASFWAAAFRPWQLLLDAMTQRKTHKELSALNDHLLKDIGISRSEIAWRSRAANLPDRSGRFAPSASDDTKSK